MTSTPYPKWSFNLNAPVYNFNGNVQFSEGFTFNSVPAGSTYIPVIGGVNGISGTITLAEPYGFQYYCSNGIMAVFCKINFNEFQTEEGGGGCYFSLPSGFSFQSGLSADILFFTASPQPAGTLAVFCQINSSNPNIYYLQINTPVPTTVTLNGEYDFSVVFPVNFI